MSKFLQRGFVQKFTDRETDSLCLTRFPPIHCRRNSNNWTVCQAIRNVRLRKRDKNIGKSPLYLALPCRVRYTGKLGGGAEQGRIVERGRSIEWVDMMDGWVDSHYDTSVLRT